MGDKINNKKENIKIGLSKEMNGKTLLVAIITLIIGYFMSMLESDGMPPWFEKYVKIPIMVLIPIAAAFINVESTSAAQLAKQFVEIIEDKTITDCDKLKKLEDLAKKIVAKWAEINERLRVEAAKKLGSGITAIGEKIFNLASDSSLSNEDKISQFVEIAAGLLTKDEPKKSETVGA